MTVREARVPLVTAAVVVEELDRIAPRLAPRAEEPGPGRAGRRRVVGASQGRPRDPGTTDREVRGRPGSSRPTLDRILAELRSLSQPLADGGGLFEYTMLVDAEAKAVIEAAVQGLSAPRPAQR